MMIMMIKGTATSWRSAGLFLATFYSPFGLPFRLFASSASSPTSSPNHGFSDASSDQAYGNMFACRPSPTLTTLYSTPQCAYGTNVLDLR